MLKKILAVASTVVLFATGAQAVTFNLTGASGGDLSGVGAKTATFDMGGVSGTVTAGSTYNNASAEITGNTSGIGVSNRRRDNPDIDGAIGDDWLTFSFNTAVQLISVAFGNVDSNDDWDVYVDGVRVANESGSNPYFFGGVVGSSFSVLADGFFDNFTVSSFTVAPIPLPASSLLLIGGLAGFGVMRRRKRMT